MHHPGVRYAAGMSQLRAAAPRLPRLILGLVCFGVGIALMVEAGLGLGPWEALNQGVARQLGLEIGTVSVLLGIPILALWWPLGERPGIGTVLNVLCIGTSTNAAGLWARISCSHSYGEGKNGIFSDGLVSSSVGKSNAAPFAAIAAAKAFSCQAITGGFSVPAAAMDFNTP